LIADVYAGKLHPRIAAGMVPLMNLQLRAIETVDLEQRVAEFEKRLTQAEDKLNGKGGKSMIALAIAQASPKGSKA